MEKSLFKVLSLNYCFFDLIYRRAVIVECKEKGRELPLVNPSNVDEKAAVLRA